MRRRAGELLRQIEPTPSGRPSEFSQDRRRPRCWHLLLLHPDAPVDQYYCYYTKCTRDPAKRAKTLEERGLDLEIDGAQVLAGHTVTVEDDRFDYGETRLISIGFLRGRMMVMVWTPRGEAAHVISLRKANDREQKAYGPRMG